MRSETIRGNVFVANLPNGMTDEQLAELFDPYGMVLRAFLARDPATGETLGHGLVLLAPDRAVEPAIEGIAAAKVGGRRIDVRRAAPDMSMTPPSRPRKPSTSRFATVERMHPAPRTYEGPVVVRTTLSASPNRERGTLRLSSSDSGAPRRRDGAPGMRTLVLGNASAHRGG